MSGKKVYNILIVDDDEDDHYLISSAFRENSLMFNIKSAFNGVGILESISATKYLPDLVLLDLNMPRVDGFEVLKKLKESQQYCRIPVVIMSTSSDDHDIDRAYASGANSYIVKPSTDDELAFLAEQIRLYWFRLSELPSILANKL